MTCSSSLTPQQTQFLDLYHESGNAGWSWLEAGYRSSTCAAARSAASRFLHRADAREYLEARQELARERSDWNVDRLIAGFARIAQSNRAKDRDVLFALREIGRLTGAYVPKPNAKRAEQVRREHIQKFEEQLSNERKLQAQGHDPSRTSSTVESSTDKTTQSERLRKAQREHPHDPKNDSVFENRIPHHSQCQSKQPPVSESP